MTDIELKPCPFCGGKAHIIMHICLDNGFVSYEVSHSELNCCMKIKSDTVYHTPEEAARAWNKRAENECMPAADIHADWIDVKTQNPPENQIVQTKIDDEKGLRNQTELIYHRGLWWFPDMSMYVYYTPTHWRALLTKSGGESNDR